MSTIQPSFLDYDFYEEEPQWVDITNPLSTRNTTNQEPQPKTTEPITIIDPLLHQEPPLTELMSSQEDSYAPSAYLEYPLPFDVPMPLIHPSNDQVPNPIQSTTTMDPHILNTPSIQSHPMSQTPIGRITSNPHPSMSTNPPIHSSVIGISQPTYPSDFKIRRDAPCVMSQWLIAIPEETDKTLGQKNNFETTVKVAFHHYPIGISLPGYQSSTRVCTSLNTILEASRLKLLGADDGLLNASGEDIEQIITSPQFMGWLLTLYIHDYVSHCFTPNGYGGTLYGSMDPLLPRSVLSPLLSLIEKDIFDKNESDQRLKNILGNSPLRFVLLSDAAIQSCLEEDSQTPSSIGSQPLVHFVVASLLRQHGGGVLDDHAQRIQVLSVNYLMNYLKTVLKLDVSNAIPNHESVLHRNVSIAVMTALILNFQFGLSDYDAFYFEEDIFPFMDESSKILTLLAILKFSHRIIDYEYPQRMVSSLLWINQEPSTEEIRKRNFYKCLFTRVLQASCHHSPCRQDDAIISHLPKGSEGLNPDNSDALLDLMIHESSLLVLRMVQQEDTNNPNDALTSQVTANLIQLKAHVAHEMGNDDPSWTIHPHSFLLLQGFESSIGLDPIVNVALTKSNASVDQMQANGMDIPAIPVKATVEALPLSQAHSTIPMTPSIAADPQRGPSFPPGPWTPQMAPVPIPSVPNTTANQEIPAMPPMPLPTVQRTDSEIERLYGISKNKDNNTPLGPPGTDHIGGSGIKSNEGLAHALGLTDAKQSLQSVGKFFSQGWKNVVRGPDETEDDAYHQGHPLSDSDIRKEVLPFAGLMSGAPSLQGHHRSHSDHPTGQTPPYCTPDHPVPSLPYEQMDSLLSTNPMTTLNGSLPSGLQQPSGFTTVPGAPIDPSRSTYYHIATSNTHPGQ